MSFSFVPLYTAVAIFILIAYFGGILTGIYSNEYSSKEGECTIGQTITIGSVQYKCLPVMMRIPSKE